MVSPPVDITAATVQNKNGKRASSNRKKPVKNHVRFSSAGTVYSQKWRPAVSGMFAAF
jgi:hypothetical protein